MYRDEHIEVRRIELFVYWTADAECAEESCHSQFTNEIEQREFKIH